jgi:hypothetical protein
MSFKYLEIPSTDIIIPTIINCKDHVLVEMTENLSVCSSVEGRHENIASVIKHLEVARKNLFDGNGKDKSMIVPSNTDLFTQVTEEVDDMVESSDEELVTHTSPSRVQLRKTSKKITKLCSPIFRIELAKKRGRPPKG